MKQSVNITRYPKLKRPVMLAAWPGVSNVALEVARYLQGRLSATEFASVDPMDFFTPLGILVQNNLAQVPVFPESKFYFIKPPKGKRDIIIFIGEAQPDQHQYDLAHAILDVAQRFKVKRVYTAAAALVQYSVETSRVWTAATNNRLLKELKRYDVTFTGTFQIRGLNGLMLGAAKEKGMEGICLLGETPQYAAELPNPMASYAVLQVLSKMLGLNLDLSDIAKEAREIAQRLKALSQEATAKYIDQLTTPIWEQNPGGDDDEDEY